MATRPTKITVRATAGRNAPVQHVLLLEDLLHRMGEVEVATKAARRLGKAGAGEPAEVVAVKRLAAELEARVRASRRPGRSTKKA
jgi:hypothetical protein